jgi:Asp-tRNA(Asn)/Glu-tRNA(Gln) amidotransferase A subunit family amidase
LATFIQIRDDEKVDAKFLKEKIHGFRSADDVFRMDFLQGIVFAVESEDKRKDLVPTEAIALLEAWGNEWLEVQVIGDGASVPALGAGVYLAFQRRLFEADRLYDDYQGAFLTPLLPGLQDDHRQLEIAGVYMGANAVAVPSRLRFKVGSKPLAGLRIAVKDNFHIKGIRTSMCNKAYYEFYPPNTQTARCIADLENAGASILGTTKLAAFAATEEPLECVDYQAPWNARGDGYQSPAGSSSGSGVAIASYEWLDIAIGSDTSGSGRRPAHWNGCFALRPSHGAVDSQGLVPSFPQFDTPTFFARGIDKCRDFAAAWYGEKLGREIDLPLRLIVPTDYLRLITNTDQVRIIDQFVADLGNALDTDPKTVSFEEVWQSSPPADSNGESLQEYMRDACRNSFFFDDFHNLDTFREDHRAKFSRVPYVSPPVRWQWDLSDKITRGERDEAVRRLAVFKAWFADEVMQEGRQMTLVVLPIENMSPRHRDQATTSFNPVGVPMLFLSPIIGGPELVVPAGHVPYVSRVSGNQEYLPVAVSLLSTTGMDLRLLDIVKHFLEKSGRPKEVAIGRTMF